ncbi:MAG: hypothetical protein ABII82_10865 [Verrucomicrobiota bacterium]
MKLSLPSPRDPRVLALLALAGVLCLAVAVPAWMYRETLRAWAEVGVEWVRELGPAAFFSAMAILPAAAVPLSVFTLTAGPVFGPTLGMPAVLALVALSMAINLVVTYVLARWILRPWLLKLCGWLGYRVPEVSPADQLKLVVLVRVTPGPPYVLQSYLLGLAAIPFRLYFAISWGISVAYAFAFVLFGRALMEGRGRMALVAISLFVAVTVAVRWIKGRVGGKSGDGRVAEITD